MTASSTDLWPRDPRYLAGEDGSIVGPSGRARRTYLDERGYPRVGVRVGGQSRAFYVHVIVCEAWYGPRSGRA